MTSPMVGEAKSGDLPERCSSFLNAREKVFRPQWEFPSRKRSRRYLSDFARQEVMGFLIFRTRIRRAFDADCHSPQSGRSKIAQRFIAGHIANRAFLLIVFGLLAVTALSVACRSTVSTRNAANTREVTDEAGRRVIVPQKIDRIVSLAPNLTEIVYAVGAGEQLVGDTEYCDYPAQAKRVAKIGDTLHPSIERIIALKPQIVLVSTASQLETFTKQLDDQHIAVYVTNPQSLDDIFRSTQALGDLFGHHDWTMTLLDGLRTRAAAVDVATKSVKPVRVFYQLSDSPLYTIGRESYLTDLVRRAGGISVTADVPGAFPRFSDEAALAAKPDAIILATGGSMGAANTSATPALKNSPAVIKNRVYKINDDLLARPGPRLVDGLEEMARALHPEVAAQFGKPQPE
jgi:iron complex transport system substrate-binding protein